MNYLLAVVISFASGDLKVEQSLWGSLAECDRAGYRITLMTQHKSGTLQGSYKCFRNSAKALENKE